MIRGFLSDVLAKWKRFRWQGLVKVWAVFMAIALVLLVESLGVHYGATRFDITYLDRTKAIPAANAIAGQKATNLLVGGIICATIVLVKTSVFPMRTKGGIYG